MYDTIGRSGMAGSGSAQSALAEAESDLVGQAEGAVSDVREQRDIEESKQTQVLHKHFKSMEQIWRKWKPRRRSGKNKQD